MHCGDGMVGDRGGLNKRIYLQGVRDPRVLAALERIDRSDFVPEEVRSEAYEDRPLALPDSQTTSQPSLIAKMAEWARIAEGDRVLEIGSGHGFQTALLSHLAEEVYSVEIHPRLAEAAASNLARSGVTNAEILVGDGWQGWRDHAPYDAIIVSAAAARVPDPLKEQLAEGGRLVIPLAESEADNVYLLRKERGEVLIVRLLTPARFVPLIPGRRS